MAEIITQKQAQKMLAFIKSLAKEDPCYSQYDIGDYLSVSWINRAEDLLDDLNLNRPECLD
jgi:hypothetical protein